MFSVCQSFSVGLNKSKSMISTLSKQRQFTIQCATINNFAFTGVVGKTRGDWQSSCAILSSTVVKQQQQQHDNNNNEKTNGVENVTLVDRDRNISDLISTVNHPKPLSDLIRTPTHGSETRVAYQGVPGAYSESAAEHACPNGEFIPCDQFQVAFQAVELWIADLAVLPLENSVAGSIHRNYDLLLRHRLHIVGEVQLPVHHCLLALPGVSKRDLNRVISHPQALAQCELTLNKLAPNVTREEAYSTAGAAEIIAERNLRDTAAIASERAAKLYGLEVIADGVHDDCNNVTRFAMLAREPIIPRNDRPFRTSIVFAHDNGTSVLFKVLCAFAFRDINLTKIECRPHWNRPVTFVDEDNGETAKRFEYMFYVDFDSSMADVRAQNALLDVQEFTTFLRVLGSYPIDMTPWSPSGGIHRYDVS